MDVVVPDLGDFADVEVIDVLVKPGDQVNPEDPLVTLETDKATMDVPSPAAGRVAALNIAVGDRVSTGDLLLSLEDTGGDSRRAPVAAPAEPQAAAPPADAPDPHAVAAASPSAEEPAAVAPRIVQVPDLGDFTDVEVIDVLVAVGDRVEAEQGLVSLETEKATMDVPTPEAGTVVELRVKIGDRVATGDVVIVLEPDRVAGAQSAPASSQSPAAVAAPAAREAQAAGGQPERRPAARAPAAPAAVVVDEAGFSKAHASPSVRKLARELGVDLGRVPGSGRKGRITSDDVKQFVKQVMRGGAVPSGPALPAVPSVDFAKFGPVETQPLSRIQRVSGPRLHASWVNIPHVTQHDEADITELEETRAKLKAQASERGIKLTPLAFVLRACVLALAEFPLVKSSLAPDGQSVVLKQYTHVGFAVDTPGGLVVPVIRDADKKDVYELAMALAALSERARQGKLQIEDLQGGVFSVSSLGGIGGRFFTPIINAPEVAILGVSRSTVQPVFKDGGFVPRLMLPLSLSYDHRVIDGALGVRFTTRLAELLGDVARLTEAIP